MTLDYAGTACPRSDGDPSSNGSESLPITYGTSNDRLVSEL
jgi:hypothetical protein